MASLIKRSEAFSTRWVKWHAFLMIVAFLLVMVTDIIPILLSFAVLSFSILIISNLQFLNTFKPFGGYCNWVTFLRWLVLMFCSFGYWKLGNTAFTAGIGFVIFVDWIDGFLARRYKQESTFGAIFDMDTDGLLAAILSLILFQEKGFTAWILIAGFLRYLFVVSKEISPLKHIVLSRPHPWAKWIAVIYFISLLLPFLFEHDVSFWILIVTSSAIVFSFLLELKNLILAKLEWQAQGINQEEK